MFLKLYSSLISANKFFLKKVLERRLKKGKEDPKRLTERMGTPSLQRPDGELVWLHAASVGETQSAFILVSALLEQNKDMNILITTGTLTSAKLIETRLAEGKLPPRVKHQFYPLDHPEWVESFLKHWSPNLVLWMESELWPNMLQAIRDSEIPCFLLNARLSEKSFNRWKSLKSDAAKILSSFTVIMAQTEQDKARFESLGAQDVKVIENLKYCAAPLPYSQREFERLKDSLQNRRVWLYASTHKGEEDIACRIHLKLKKDFPDLLTIIVPRHPERRDEIKPLGEKYNIKIRLRQGNKTLPTKDDDVYVADTLGELGLFYHISPIAVVGRSLSQDGGGGHNPIEAAQHDCAILYGSNIQNLAQIYNDFRSAGAALCIPDEKTLGDRVMKLLSDEEGRAALQHKAQSFVKKKGSAIKDILAVLKPHLQNIHMTTEEKQDTAKISRAQ